MLMKHHPPPPPHHPQSTRKGEVRNWKIAPTASKSLGHAWRGCIKRTEKENPNFSISKRKTARGFSSVSRPAVHGADPQTISQGVEVGGWRGGGSWQPSRAGRGVAPNIWCLRPSETFSRQRIRLQLLHVGTVPNPNPQNVEHLQALLVPLKRLYA